MSLRDRLDDSLPVAAPLVLNPLMARMVEAAGFPRSSRGRRVYADLAADFGGTQPKTDWSPVEHEMLGVIGIEKLLAVERATVEKGHA